MPFPAEPEHPLGLHVQLDEVGVRAQRGVRAAQLGEERVLEQRLAEIALGDRGEVGSGHQQAIGPRPVQILPGGAHPGEQPHVLPAAGDLGDARARRQRARGDVGELALLDRSPQGEFLDRRVADRDVVAGLQAVLGHLRGLHLDAEAVAA